MWIDLKNSIWDGDVHFGYIKRMPCIIDASKHVHSQITLIGVGITAQFKLFLLHYYSPMMMMMMMVEAASIQCWHL